MLTQKLLTEIIKYNPNTGIFIWSDRKHCSGKIAGCKDSKGYVIITVYRKQYKAHRLAFLYMEGEFPEEYVDHINGIPSDNRFINLRKANKSENVQNQKKAQKDNKSTGLLGAYQFNGYFFSAIAINGKTKRLGSFKTPEEAHEAYLKAKRELHPFGTL